MKAAESLFATALPQQGKRILLFMTLVALPVLLLYLGKSELLNVEGELASCVRMMQGPGISTERWYPDSCHTVIFGRLINELSRIFPMSEWLLRIPSLLAALAMLAGTILLSLEIFERKNAVFAGWLLLGSYGFLYWGRVGSSPMFGAAAAMWCVALFFGRKSSESSLFRRSFDFFVMLGAVLLFCGYTTAIGIILLLLPQWFSMLKNRCFSWKKCFIVLSALLLDLIFLTLLLYIVVYSDNPQLRWDGSLYRMADFCYRLSVGSFRELISLNHGITVAEALLNLPRLLLPWSLLIPAAAVGLWKKRHMLPDNFIRLLCGMGLYILFIGIFPGRRWGALLPLLGPAVIAISAGLSARYRDIRFERYSELIVRGIFIIIAALFAALFCTWPLWDELLRVDAPTMLMLLSTLAGLTTLALLTFGITSGNPIEKIMKRPSPLSGTILAGVVLSVFVNCVFLPQMNRFRTGRRFWTRSAAAIEQCDPAPEMVIFYRCGIPKRGIYYLNLRQPFVMVSTPQDADRILHNCGGKVAMISSCEPEIISEISSIAARNRKRFNPDAPMVAEELPIAFVNSDTRSPWAGYATWLLEL